MNIFVGSLPLLFGGSRFKRAFEAYGEVTSVKIIMDRESGRSKGFGFVEMSDDESAQKAISGLNGSEVSGRSIAVSQAEDKKPGDRRGGSGGGGGYGGGNRGGGGGGYSRDNNRGGGGGGYSKDSNRGGGGSRW